MKFAASILLCLLVAACAMQSYQAKPLDPAATAQAFSARTAADAGLSDVPVWDLPALTQAALRLHPDLQVARAQWQAAQAEEKTAAQSPIPSFSAGAEHHTRTDEGISPWTLTLGIGIPIETHGKREARIEQAQALSDAARLDIANTAWQVRSRVRARLLDYYAARQRVQQLQRQERPRAEIVSLLQARLNVGLASTVEMADARLQLRRVEAALDAENGQLNESRAALAAAIALPEKALDDTRLGFRTFEQDIAPLPSDEMQRMALQNRLDVRRELLNYAATEAALKLEIAKQYPDINLDPTYSWDQGDNRWGLGFSQLLTLIRGNDAAIASAEAARELEAKRFEALQISVISEKEQAAAAWQASLNELQHNRKLLQEQKDRLAQTQSQFDAGQMDRLDLTLASLELQAAEAAVMESNIKVQQALGRLEDAVQRPLQLPDDSSGVVVGLSQQSSIQE
ncbi:MAG TPA: TolC family protein [Methylophilaceae bacterium]